MFTGFYTVASGMFMQQRSLNTIASNMSNADTAGYRAQRVTSTTFEHEMLIRQERGKNNPIGKGAPARVVEDVPTAFDPASLQATGRPFDLAINGAGYFNIAPTAANTGTGAAQEGQADEAGVIQTYLTRDGNFNVDDEGFLMLQDRGRVMGVKGEIQIGLNSTFEVRQNGEVYNEKGRFVDQLLITEPRPGTKLARATNGMYEIDPNPPLTTAQLQAIAAGGAPPQTAEPGLIPSTAFGIEQGVIERSNVNFNQEMSLMIETQRNFQSCSKALQMLDTVNQKTTSIAAL